MKKQTKAAVAIIASLGVLTILIFCAYQVLILRKAHSSFSDYYAFRGCVQLIGKTDRYGTCKLASGQIIKMVQYHNKWYLDGDLPGVPALIQTFLPLLPFLLLWSVFWKGLALWHAGRRGQPWWFVILLVVNTLGILEIIYLFGVIKLEFSQLFSRDN